MIRKERWQLLSLVVNEKNYLHVMRLKYDPGTSLSDSEVPGLVAPSGPYLHTARLV